MDREEYNRKVFKLMPVVSAGIVAFVALWVDFGLGRFIVEAWRSLGRVGDYILGWVLLTLILLIIGYAPEESQQQESDMDE